MPKTETRYRALQPIEYEGVRAYNAGDWVPVENVERYGYLDDCLVEAVEVNVEDEPDGTEAPVIAVPPESPAEAKKQEEADAAAAVEGERVPETEPGPVQPDLEPETKTRARKGPDAPTA